MSCRHLVFVGNYKVAVGGKDGFVSRPTGADPGIFVRGSKFPKILTSKKKKPKF